MPKAPRWRIFPGLRLHWQSWENEFVVYNSASGDTHLLDQVCRDALEILESESPTLSELAGRLAESQEIEADAEFSTYLEHLLAKLEKLGLVERIET